MLFSWLVILQFTVTHRQTHTDTHILTHILTHIHTHTKSSQNTHGCVNWLSDFNSDIEDIDLAHKLFIQNATLTNPIHSSVCETHCEARKRTIPESDRTPSHACGQSVTDSGAAVSWGLHHCLQQCLWCPCCTCSMSSCLLVSFLQK